MRSGERKLASMELAASSRSWSRGNSKVRWARRYSVEKVGAEEGWVVGVEGDHEAFFEVELDGGGHRGGTTTGAEVAGDVELEGDLAFDENFDEVGIFLRGEGMADALGADVDGGPDALRAGVFAGVGR